MGLRPCECAACGAVLVLQVSAVSKPGKILIQVETFTVNKPNQQKKGVRSNESGKITKLFE